MLNEGTSIVASFSVGVRLMEGTHESPVWSLYGLKTLLCVTGVIVQSLVACQNTRYTCWNGDAKPFFFSRNVERALACAQVEVLTQFWKAYGRITTWCTSLHRGKKASCVTGVWVSTFCVTPGPLRGISSVLYCSSRELCSHNAGLCKNTRVCYNSWLRVRVFLTFTLCRLSKQLDSFEFRTFKHSPIRRKKKFWYLWPYNILRKKLGKVFSLVNLGLKLLLPPWKEECQNMPW